MFDYAIPTHSAFPFNYIASVLALVRHPHLNSRFIHSFVRSFNVLSFPSNGLYCIAVVLIFVLKGVNCVTRSFSPTAFRSLL